MTHPSRDQWVAYLYGELDRKSEAVLTEHLGTCRECQAQVSAWRGVMAELDAWQLPEKRARALAVWRLVRWAAAAVLLMGFGLGIGRVWAPDVEALRESLEASIGEELREELAADVQASTRALQAQVRDDLYEHLCADFNDLAAQTVRAASAVTGHYLNEFARSVEAARAEDRQAIGLVLGNLEFRRLSDRALLQNGLETLATVTEDEFLRTREDMVRLAVFSEQSTPASKVSDVPDRGDERRPK